MELRAGYKETEVGAIPEDWDVVEAFNLNPFITSGSRGWAKYYGDRGDLFMRITNLSRQSIYPDLSDQKLVDLPKNDTEGLRTALIDGDILISITADIGIIGYVNEAIPKPAYINQHISCLRLPPNKADSRFQSYFLASHGPQKRFAEMTDVGAKSGINLTTVGKLKLLCPPLPEQHAIAAVLSDADALIASLDALIGKKRDLKRAAMQQLLTSKTRLPGFAGEWEMKPLGELCSMRSGEGITAKNIDDFSPFPCFGGNGLRGFTDRYTHDGRYCLIGRVGALCGNLLQVSGRFFASEHAIVVTAFESVDIGWLTLALGTLSLNRRAESSAQPVLTVSKLTLLDLLVPPTRDEQSAIAAVVSDMDADLAAVEAKRDKVFNIKQGMMQELLAGRIRLV